MIIGIDIDNTIVCYDKVFLRLAARQGMDVPEDLSPKRFVRDTLRRIPGGEVDWTLLQGQVYGPEIKSAEPFFGACETIANLIKCGHKTVIISHKTRFPAIGPSYDLHRFARNWIECWLNNLPLNIFFETTRWKKLRRIESEGCDLFIDDLHSLLEDPSFPQGVNKIWFSPDLSSQRIRNLPHIRQVTSWSEISSCIQDMPASRNHRKLKSAERYREEPFAGSIDDLFSEFLFRSLNLDLKSWKPLKGGINNKVVKLETPDGRIMIGKLYKRMQDDPRDRLMHESRFLNLLEKAGIGCVPRVLAVDKKIGIAVHTKVAGEPWPEGIAVPSTIWRQFSVFLDRVQEAVSFSESAMIPFAAEAAMSLQEHLGWVQQRRDLWRSRALDGELSSAIRHLVLEDLEKEYDQVANSAIAHTEFRCRVPSDQLILTPSDFGLHNALVTPEGKLHFIDFEYAGWDDPIKTDVDFALQPRYHVGRPKHLDCLKDRIDSTSSRTKLIHGLLSLKWQYIVLAANHAG